MERLWCIQAISKNEKPLFTCYSCNGLFFQKDLTVPLFSQNLFLYDLEKTEILEQTQVQRWGQVFKLYIFLYL